MLFQVHGNSIFRDMAGVHYLELVWTTKESNYHFVSMLEMFENGRGLLWRGIWWGCLRQHPKVGCSGNMIGILMMLSLRCELPFWYSSIQNIDCKLCMCIYMYAQWAEISHSTGSKFFFFIAEVGGELWLIFSFWKSKGKNCLHSSLVQEFYPS